MQVWTYKGRVAFVLSVLEKDKPVADCMKLRRLSQIMLDIMGGDLRQRQHGSGVAICPGIPGSCRSIFPPPAHS